jgi:hypothetical protein
LCDTNGMRERKLLAVVVTVGLLALAGCGGGGHKTPSAPTKAQYISQADALCKAAGAKTGPLIHQIALGAASLVTGGPSAANQIASLLVQLHSEAAGTLAKLQALAQPKGDAKKIEAFLTPLSSIVDAISGAVTALHQGKVTQVVTSLEAAAPLATQVKSAASSYGLTQCESVIPAFG